MEKLPFLKRRICTKKNILVKICFQSWLISPLFNRQSLEVTKLKKNEKNCFSRYLLTQTYSKDLINHVLSLKKPTKEIPTPGICFPLQRQLVISLLELMRMAEQGIRRFCHFSPGFIYSPQFCDNLQK